jgi:hypothetical protein
MTRFQHTPGPWQSDGHFITAPDPKGKHFDIYIAEMVHEDDEGRLAPKKQRIPNASLISAATEMFDALELCEEVLAWLARLDDGTPSVSALHMARDALAKAKGGRP